LERQCARIRWNYRTLSAFSFMMLQSNLKSFVKKQIVAATIVSCAAHANPFGNGSWKVQAIQNKDDAKILAIQKSAVTLPRGQHFQILSMPAALYQDGTSIKGENSKDETTYLEYLADNRAFTTDMAGMALRWMQRKIREGEDYSAIRVSGTIENRINITVLGDGYLQKDKEKFLNDVTRLIKEAFTDDSLIDLTPIVNIFAVFTPSLESGVGEGHSKNTVFKIYRYKQKLKIESKKAEIKKADAKIESTPQVALIPGDQAAVEKALQYSPATDYPIIIAKDAGDGALAGRYAIVTSGDKNSGRTLSKLLNLNFSGLRKNIWSQFIAQINLIDGVEVGADLSQKILAAPQQIVRVKVPDLKNLHIRWYKCIHRSTGDFISSDDVEIPGLRDQLVWRVPANVAGDYKIRATISSSSNSASFSSVKSISL